MNVLFHHEAITFGDFFSKTLKINANLLKFSNSISIKNVINNLHHFAPGIFIECGYREKNKFLYKFIETQYRFKFHFSNNDADGDIIDQLVWNYDYYDNKT